MLISSPVQLVGSMKKVGQLEEGLEPRASFHPHPLLLILVLQQKRDLQPKQQ